MILLVRLIIVQKHRTRIASWFLRNVEDLVSVPNYSTWRKLVVVNALVFLIFKAEMHFLLVKEVHLMNNLSNLGTASIFWGATLRFWCPSIFAFASWCLLNFVNATRLFQLNWLPLCILWQHRCCFWILNLDINQLGILSIGSSKWIIRLMRCTRHRRWHIPDLVLLLFLFLYVIVK